MSHHLNCSTFMTNFRTNLYIKYIKIYIFKIYIFIYKFIYIYMRLQSQTEDAGIP